MKKIDGFTKERATSLIEFIEAGRRAGKSIMTLFKEYGTAHALATLSVRNYYYAILKNQNDERVREILKGREISVRTAIKFSEEETKKLIEIFEEGKRRNLSVRRTALEAAGGNDRLALRMVNKYRSIIARERQQKRERKYTLTVGEFIENFGGGKIFDFEDAGGIDVYDDYDERYALSFYGGRLTEAGKEHFKLALSLHCRIFVGPGPYARLIVMAKNDEEAEAIHQLMTAAAGYCSEKEYDEWFEEETA